ncbi:MAG: hypothetical protein DRO06_02345 [Thermoproteota archaeon]|nr:MAG: hypothetical protein DRO06_02345 [Candidatus Korarchaeota archaeon]
MKTTRGRTVGVEARIAGPCSVPVFDYELTSPTGENFNRRVSTISKSPVDVVLKIRLEEGDPAGNYTLRIWGMCLGSGFSDSKTVTVEVVNLAPSISASAPREVVRGAEFEVSVQVEDPDGPEDALSIQAALRSPSGESVPVSVSGSPPVVTVSAAIPPGYPLGIYELEISAVDADGGSADSRLELSVVNSPPQVTELSLSGSLREGGEVIVRACASDPDGSPEDLAFELSVSLSGKLLFEGTLPGEGECRESDPIRLPESGKLSVSLSVSDPDGGTAEKSITSTVQGGSDGGPGGRPRGESLGVGCGRSEEEPPEGSSEALGRVLETSARASGELRILSVEYPSPGVVEITVSGPEGLLAVAFCDQKAFSAEIEGSTAVIRMELSPGERRVYIRLLDLGRVLDSTELTVRVPGVVDLSISGPENVEAGSTFRLEVFNVGTEGAEYRLTVTSAGAPLSSFTGELDPGSAETIDVEAPGWPGALLACVYSLGDANSSNDCVRINVLEPLRPYVEVDAERNVVVVGSSGGSGEAELRVLVDGTPLIEENVSLVEGSRLEFPLPLQPGRHAVRAIVSWPRGEVEDSAEVEVESRAASPELDYSSLIYLLPAWILIIYVFARRRSG